MWRTSRASRAPIRTSESEATYKMGKGNKKAGSSKAAEKKRERLEMEKLMNSRVQLVKAANDVDDPLENLPSFKVTKAAFSPVTFPTILSETVQGMSQMMSFPIISTSS